MNNYKEEIEKSCQILKAFRKSKELFDKEKDILEFMEERYKLYYSQIHEYLAPKKQKETEIEIRNHIKNIFSLDLPICEIKIEKFRNALPIYEKKGDDSKLELCYQYLQRWLDLYENNFALVAFRSLEHWAYFSEWDKMDSEKFWKYSIDTLNDNGYSGCTKGFFYYANQMVLDNKIKFMLKQMPTSFGKSFSDSVMISFIFGVNKNEQVIKVVGNRSLPSKCCRQVVDLMCNKRFRQVFPEYQAMVEDETKDIQDQIFTVCAIKDGILTIKNSGRDTSYESFSKETKRDGIRGGWLFLDDIVQRKEIMNIKQHEEDINDFDGTWKKRSRDENTFRIVCGGTTYDPYDLLETLKFRYSKGQMKKSQVNKYTTLSMDEDAVFVCVPKLDEKDQLTFPQKTVLSSVLDDRKNNYDLFMAMDMQQPVAPKDTPFYWNYLQTYSYVPSDATPYCYAALDPARSGKNFVAMIICKIVKEMIDGKEIEMHYPIDVLYLMTPMDKVYDPICGLIEKHHIIKLQIEKNTDTSLKYVIGNKLIERNVSFCEINETYSTQNKEEKIYMNENVIKTRFRFPERGMYPRISQFGQFMEHIVSYKYKGADFDDAPDVTAIYANTFINGKQEKPKAKLLFI